MKDYSWRIKISDLLSNPWDTDYITFENKFLKTDDVKLINNGISWKIFLQWLNENEILLKIDNLSFEVEYLCDKCLWKYTSVYNLNNLEEVRFVNPMNIEIKENIHDNLFPIDMKNQNIDIHELIEIIVKNEEPIIKKCWKCKNKNLKEEEKNQEQNSYYKIDFWKMLKK